MATPAAFGNGSAGLDLGPQRSMIVDLAIVVEDQSPVRREHRLMPRRREVDDGQTAVPKADATLAIDPNAFVIGPPMFDCVRHPPEERGLRRFKRQDAGDSTHSAYPLGRNGRLVKHAMTALR